MVLGPHLHGWV